VPLLHLKSTRAANPNGTAMVMEAPPMCLKDMFFLSDDFWDPGF
jgi:hypothetical protein